MSKKETLTSLQKDELARLSQYFEKLEKLAVRNNIDLDVFISEYKDDGYAFYATEQIELQRKAARRKKVMEKSSKDKSEKSSSTRKS